MRPGHNELALGCGRSATATSASRCAAASGSRPVRTRRLPTLLGRLARLHLHRHLRWRPRRPRPRMHPQHQLLQKRPRGWTETLKLQPSLKEPRSTAPKAHAGSGDEHIRVLRTGTLQPGRRVEATWNEGRLFYPGTIVRANNDGTYVIHFDDGDKDRKANPKNIRIAPIAGRSRIREV